jgi:gliding motility-associated lipoprotein GldH
MIEFLQKSFKTSQKRVILAVFGGFLLFSCSTPPLIDELTTFENQEWHMDSVVKSQWIPLDSGTPVFVSLYVRHLTDYPYNNLYLFRTILTQNGVAYSDTVNVHLADALGRWNGTGMSTLKTILVPVSNSAVRFRTDERYTLTVQHGMRDTLLYGIQNLGVRLTVAE